MEKKTKFCLFHLYLLGARVAVVSLNETQFHFLTIKDYLLYLLSIHHWMRIIEETRYITKIIILYAIMKIILVRFNLQQ